ncbi:hypothetical protein BDN70DRAFT_963442 [Pholiota conissans]|uniref:F-box domain-containing protein n=1 Tax=Pholiota conissans TaxID=109636 RepID=A0A9P5YQ44_9AGAR|nr:hypothetical protein BDN70DRAFT_963442 [Pholiota conissans]
MTSSSSPITRLPYDMLREIFIHYVPSYPFLTPNSKSAPIFLCHICSSWRMAALTCPTLWSHLSHCITLQEIDFSISWTEHTVLKRDIEFLLWWKGNQGSNPPFLVLGAKAHKENDIDDDKLISLDALDTIVEFIASAQYLDAHPFFWELLQKSHLSLVNLRTLAMIKPFESRSFLEEAQKVLSRLPENPSAAFPSSKWQQICLNKGNSIDFASVITVTWSYITHISLADVKLSLPSWFSFLVGVPKLQWAYINIKQLNPHDFTNSNRTHILNHLASLFLTCQDGCDLIHLFKNLRLPALTTLSLSSYSPLWKDDISMSRIYSIIRTTPNVITLALDDYFLSAIDYNRPINPNTTKWIWKLTPSLAHVHLDLSSESETPLKDSYDRIKFLIRYFSACCAIQSITVIDKYEAVSNSDKAALEELVKINSFCVDLCIASSSLDQAASEVWKEWGSRA